MPDMNAPPLHACSVLRQARLRRLRGRPDRGLRVDGAGRRPHHLPVPARARTAARAMLRRMCTRNPQPPGPHPGPSRAGSLPSRLAFLDCATSLDSLRLLLTFVCKFCFLLILFVCCTLLPPSCPPAARPRCTTRSACQSTPHSSCTVQPSRCPGDYGAVRAALAALLPDTVRG